VWEAAARTAVLVGAAAEEPGSRKLELDMRCEFYGLLYVKSLKYSYEGTYMTSRHKMLIILLEIV
jgi:hypothetical protein